MTVAWQGQNSGDDALLRGWNPGKLKAELTGVAGVAGEWRRVMLLR